MADMNGLTVAQLKEKLKASGLPVTGKKDDLIQRLQGAEVDAAPAAASPSEAAAPDEQPAIEETAAATQPSEPAKAQPATADDPLSKRLARFGDGVLSESDRMKKREERFKTGDVIGDSDKVSARADRFGIITEEKQKEQEVARAKRFNMDTPETLEEKKKARSERFSKAATATVEAPASLSELEGMIKKRA